MAKKKNAEPVATEVTADEKKITAEEITADDISSGNIPQSMLDEHINAKGDAENE